MVLGDECHHGEVFVPNDVLHSWDLGEIKEHTQVHKYVCEQYDKRLGGSLRYHLAFRIRTNSRTIKTVR